MKKIFFSLFAIFSLFFINDSVFASTSDLAIENLYLSMEEYYEIGDYIEFNYGPFTDILGYNVLWLTRTSYLNGEFIKEYFVIYYDKIIDSYIIKDNNNFIWWEFYCEDYVSFHVTRYLTSDEIEYGYEEKFNTGKGWPFSFPGMGSPRLELFDYNNYGSSTYSLHFGMSTNAIPIYTNSDEKELYLFYHPGYNFDKSITISDLTDNPQADYDDFYADSDNSNLNIFERIWNGIVNIVNSIISLPEKIVESILYSFNRFFEFVFPDQEYFETQIAALNLAFKEELGFIYESFDYLFNILNRFLNIGNGSKVINIPTIKEPISGYTIIQGTTFNFDDVLNSSNIKPLHNLYLAFVDVLVFVGLLNLGKKQFDRVIGGRL